MSATTPQTLAGTDSVTACTVTSCSFPQTQRQLVKTGFVFFTAGNPVVTSVSPRSGPASGGTAVTITGRNLGSLVSVRFGKRLATISARALERQQETGNTRMITVTSPPGHPGHTVAVRVTTVESQDAAGGAPSRVTKKTTFRYRASPPSAPRHVTARSQGSTVRVSWHQPLVTGGAAITGYRILLEKLGSRKTTAKPIVVTVAGTARSAVLRDVSSGDFVVKVEAVNGHGHGPAGRGFATITG
jgi:hypothetical protein